MTIISSTRGNVQFSDLAAQTALPMIGTASREDGQTVISNIDVQHSKLFEDRNVLLADGGTLSYATGTPSVLTLTTTLKLILNSQVAGGTPTTITLTGTSFNFSAAGNMLYAVISRVAGTATITSDAATLPSVVAANQEVFLIAKRVDGATQRVYLRNGQSIGNAESVILGSASTSSDANFQVFDDVTPTKIMKFQLSGLTVGTQTFTPPPVSDTLAGLATAQTFTAIQTHSATIQPDASGTRDLGGVGRAWEFTYSSAFVAGEGESTGTPTQGLIRASQGTGTDIPGTNLQIHAGNGTGTGGSGNIIFRTSPSDPGSSATPNTPVLIGQIDKNGLWFVGPAAGAVAHAIRGTLSFNTTETTQAVNGIRRSATNTLAFSTNSVDRLTADTANLTSTLPIIPGTDNTLDLGSTSFRWKELHVGPTSVVFHNDNTNTNKVNLISTGVTGAQTLTLPNATDTLVGKATTDILTNKDHDGGTASNTSRITVPKDVLTNLNALTRKQGTLVYDTTTNALLVDNGSILNAIGAGAGEVNAIANPNEASNWAASGAGVTVATTTTSTDLPLGGVISSAIKITPVSGSDYVRYRWTMPTALLGKKLKTSWFQHPLTGYAAGDLKIEMYSNSASNYGGSYVQLPLSTDVSGISGIPAGDGYYNTSFSASSVLYYEMRIIRTAGTTALNITDVVVGPGTVVQGAAVSEWASWTPTLGTGVRGTNTEKAYWRRVGSSMQISYQYLQTVAGTAGSGSYTWSIPAGFTIDPSQGAAGSNNMGPAYAYNGTTEYTGYVVSQSTTTLGLVIFTSISATASAGSANISYANTTQWVRFTCMVPIAEWAGSGTVNVVQNDIENLANSNTSTSVSDTTSFSYGSGGAAIVAIASAGTTVKKRVRSQRPMGANSGRPKLQVSPNGISWFAAESVLAYMESGTERYGMRLVIGGTTLTDLDVEFGGDGASGTEAWSTYTAWSWRVVMEQPGVAIGFGEVQPGLSSGLVSANGLKGVADTSSAPTQYVGEFVTSSITASVSGSATSGVMTDTGCSIQLTAGDWDIHLTGCVDAQCTAVGSAGVATQAEIFNFTDTAAVIAGMGGFCNTAVPLAYHYHHLQTRISISSTKTYKARFSAITVTGSPTGISCDANAAASRPFVLFARRVR